MISRRGYAPAALFSTGADPARRRAARRLPERRADERAAGGPGAAAGRWSSGWARRAVRRRGGGGWSPAMPASTLPDGSQVATGRGGRLIVARAGTHISAGPASRFSLPDAAPDAPLGAAGRLAALPRDRGGAGQARGGDAVSRDRGRRARSSTSPSAPTATEVVGRARQGADRDAGRAAPDRARRRPVGLCGRRGRRRAGLPAHAGRAAGAGRADRPARHAPATGRARRPPAASVPRTDYAGSRASSSGAAASAAAVPLAKAEIATSAQGRPAPPALAARQPQPPRPMARPSPARARSSRRRWSSARLAAARIMPPLSEARAARSNVRSAGDGVSEDPLRSAFDRLSEGMLDGVPAASSAERFGRRCAPRFLRARGGCQPGRAAPRAGGRCPLRRAADGCSSRC